MTLDFMPAFKNGRLRICGALLLFCMVALVFRVCFSYEQVFLPEYVRFVENDPWYHVRAVEYLVAHFPHRLKWDPYALQPGGQYVGIAPLLDYCIAVVALILGAGNPGLPLIHRVCAWAPALLGAMFPLPMYFLGKELFDRRAGLLAAATIAVLPGPFLQRSFLGFTDHHVLESLLILVCGLFLVRLFRVEPASETPTDAADCVKSRINPNKWRHALLAGLFMGLYLLAWVGGSLLVLVFFFAFIVHVVVERVRNRHVHSVLACVALAWAVALLMVWPFRDTPGFGFHITALGGSFFFLMGAATWAWMLRNTRHGKMYFLLGLIALTVLGLNSLRLADPGHFGEAIQGAKGFLAGRAADVVVEARSAIFEDGSFTLRPVYGMFQVAACTAPLGVLFLLWRLKRHPTAGVVFFLVWTFAIGLATAIQNRFGYYLAVNVALLSGIAWSRLTSFISFQMRGNDRFTIVLAPLLAFCLFIAVGIAPNIAQAYIIAHEQFFPHPDWREAMNWLKEKTPEPFTASNAFLGTFSKPSGKGGASAESSPYGVMCWCDHGYWITEMGHRAPTSNPTQAGLSASARLFTSQDEQAASEVMEKQNARYVVVDASLPMDDVSQFNELVGGFEAIVKLSGRDILDYYEPYLEPQKDGSYKPVILYYPEYFRSMLNRLYLFGGQEYVPEWKTWLVHFSMGTTQDGIRLKRIDQSLQFKTYEKAVEFQSLHADESWRIVSFSPQESCIPLESLRRFDQVYRSPTKPEFAHDRPMGFVEIFEFDQAR